MKNRIFYKVLRIAQNKFIPIFIKNNFFVKNWKNLKEPLKFCIFAKKINFG